jgi:hypothetical protein
LFDATAGRAQERIADQGNAEPSREKWTENMLLIAK